MNSRNNGRERRKDKRKKKQALKRAMPSLVVRAKDAAAFKAKLDVFLSRVNSDLNKQFEDLELPIALAKRMQQGKNVREEVEAFGEDVTFATILCGKRNGNIVPVHHKILLFQEAVHDIENYPQLRRYGEIVQTKYLYRSMKWLPEDAKPGDVPALIHVYQYEFSSEKQAAGKFQELFLRGRIVMYDGEGTLKPYEAPKDNDEDDDEGSEQSEDAPC